MKTLFNPMIRFAINDLFDLFDNAWSIVSAIFDYRLILSFQNSELITFPSKCRTIETHRPGVRFRRFPVVGTLSAAKCPFS